MSPLVDNDPVTAWPDDSPSANDAALFAGQSAPTYKANGFDTGIPSVRTTAGGTTGMYYAVPTPGAQTRYLVLGAVSGLGSGGRSFDNGTIFSGHGASNISDIGLGLRADEKLALSVGENAVATTFRSGTSGSALSVAHLICVTYSPGRASVYVDDMTSAVISLTGLDATDFDDYPNEFIGIGGSVQTTSIGADYGRVVAYDAEHGATERAAIKAILDVQWGL